MDYAILCFLIILSIFFILIILKKKNILKERFETDISKEKSKEKDKKDTVDVTPAEKGLIFGYLPDNIPIEKIERKKDPNTIYSNDSISIFNKNNYLGYSNKNPFIPNILQSLGSFSPYLYQTIKICLKPDNFNKDIALENDMLDDTPQAISYNTSVVYFIIKHLQEVYFLQYVPNTSTFYLTKTPSFYSLLNGDDTSKSTEALYGNNTVIKCLDNSEYIFVYENLLITESDKSSSFVIKKSDVEDICLNFNSSAKVDLSQFLPQYLDPLQASFIEQKFQKEVDDYISKIENEKLQSLKLLQTKITLLETKLNNSNSKLQLDLNLKKLKYESDLKNEKKKLQDEILAYKKKKEDEFNLSRTQLLTDKKTKWEKDLEDLKQKINKECQIKA
jgi:hypothetical protein